MTWILLLWQEFHSCGKNFSLVVGISVRWQEFHSGGRNFNILAEMLFLWQEFDSYGINFILSEKMRQFMRGFGFRIPVRHCVFPVYNVPTSPGKITVCLEEFQNLKIRIMEFWVLEFWIWKSDQNFGIPNVESQNIDILNFGIQIWIL